MFWKFAVRDGVVVLLCAGCWSLDAVLRGPGLPAVLSAVLAAVTATLVGYVAHEWGHLSGALLLGSKVYAPRPLFSPFLFHFDTQHNNARQFLAMSLGGFVASALFATALLVWLPLATLAAKLTLLLVGIGVLATLAVEVPGAWRVARGAPLPTGPVFEPV